MATTDASIEGQQASSAKLVNGSEALAGNKETSPFAEDMAEGTWLKDIPFTVRELADLVNEKKKELKSVLRWIPASELFKVSNKRYCLRIDNLERSIQRRAQSMHDAKKPPSN